MLCLYKLIDNLRRFYHLLILHDRAQASLPGFKVLPLHQFGTWGSLITDEFDPEKDTYVLVIKEFLKFSTIFWSSLNNWDITSCCWCCLYYDTVWSHSSLLSWTAVSPWCAVSTDSKMVTDTGISLHHKLLLSNCGYFFWWWVACLFYVYTTW